LVAVLALIQAQRTSESQDLAQQRQLVLLQKENEITEAIGTTIARAIPPGPTASAVAVLIAPLEQTRVALDLQRQASTSQSSLTLPASTLATHTPGIPVTVLPIQDIGGQVNHVGRRENTLTIDLNLQNNSAEPQYPNILLMRCELFDEGTGTSYRFVRGNSSTQPLQPGESTRASLQFEVPIDESPNLLTLRIRNGTMFQHIPIPTALP
jgi:hypothetical protein